MFACVVLIFDPLAELSVECFERTQIELLDQEAITDGSEKAFDLSFGRAIIVLIITAIFSFSNTGIP